MERKELRNKFTTQPSPILRTDKIETIDRYDVKF